MSVTKTTTKIGIEDANIAAAGGTFSRTRVVNGATTTGTVSYFNAGSFPFTTANQSTITGAGWAATNPSAFAAELGPVLAASVANAAALQAITWTPTAGQSIIVRDIKRPFIWDASSTTAEDGVSVIKVTAITTGRWLSESVYSADSATTATTATVANGLKTATNTVSISAATAPTTYQVLKATAANTATWQDDIARGVKSATTSIDLAAATAPATGQILTATGASAATWQDNYAIGVKSATTSVNTNAAAAPSSGQVLMATGASAATWQTISSASYKATFSDTTTSVAGSSTTTKTVNVGAGKACVLVFLATTQNTVYTAGSNGAIVLATTTASDARSFGYGGTGTTYLHFNGSTALSDICFDGSASYIYLRSVTYNAATGDVDLVFYNTNGGAQTVLYYGLMTAF